MVHWASSCKETHVDLQRMAWIQKEESDDQRRNRHYLWRHGSRRPQGRSESPFPLLDNGEARQGQLLLLLSLRRILAGRLCPSWKGQGSTCTKSWLVVCKSVIIEHFSGNSPAFVHCHAQLCCIHRNMCTLTNSFATVVKPLRLLQHDSQVFPGCHNRSHKFYSQNSITQIIKILLSEKNVSSFRKWTAWYQKV